MLRSSKLLCAIGVIAALSAAPPAPTLRMAAHVDHVDMLAREPMVVELPDGALFASGYGSGHPALWKSLDHGATWNRVDVGTTEEGAIGNSDVDLAAAADGTLYYINLTYDREKHEGTQIAVGVSRDSGGHWTWRTLSKSRFDDRPWVVVASDGIAHVIWNDGKGVLHSTSRVGTWTEPERIAPKGGSSHLAAGPNRLIAARITPASANGNKFDPAIVEKIAVSTDGGTSWRMHDAPGERKWSASDDFPPRWVEPVAWDDDGKLYSFWTNDHELWLGRSVNRGETWKTWKLGESKESAYYPYLVGHGGGELACTWFSGRDDAILGHAAMIAVGAGNEPPRFVEATPFQIDAWYETVDGRLTRATAGEYLGIAFLRSGGFGVVSPVQHVKDRRYGGGFTWMRFVYSERP